MVGRVEVFDNLAQYSLAALWVIASPYVTKQTPSPKHFSYFVLFGKDGDTSAHRIRTHSGTARLLFWVGNNFPPFPFPSFLPSVPPLHFPLPSLASRYHILPWSLPLKSRYRVWGSVVSSPSRSIAQPPNTFWCLWSKNWTSAHSCIELSLILREANRQDSCSVPALAHFVVQSFAINVRMWRWVQLCMAHTIAQVRVKFQHHFGGTWAPWPTHWLRHCVQIVSVQNCSLIHSCSARAKRTLSLVKSDLNRPFGFLDFGSWNRNRLKNEFLDFGFWSWIGHWTIFLLLARTLAHFIM